jgi:5-formyltetrahydrofolate cyclo-ligase
MDWPEIRAWRKARREELIAARVAMDREAHARACAAIEALLEPILAARPDAVIGFCWPFKREFEPRPLMRRLARAGFSLALPAVVEPRTPMEFRAWAPGTKLVPGIWNIPVP